MTNTIEVVVRLTISEDDFEVNRLEERVRAARDQGGRELLVRALAVPRCGTGAVRQRQVERRLDTTPPSGGTWCFAAGA